MVEVVGYQHHSHYKIVASVGHNPLSLQWWFRCGYHPSYITYKLKVSVRRRGSYFWPKNVSYNL